MAQKVIMPKQGLQMTEGVITSWLVKEGGQAVEGKPLFEMETDKLNITIDANATGTLLKIVRGEGETVPITETIAVIGVPGEDISAFMPEGSAAVVSAENAPEAEPEEKKPETVLHKKGERIFITPRARSLAQEKGYDTARIPATGPEGLIIERDVKAYVPVKATPLAKKVAELNGVELAELSGTGVRGKITKEDVLAAMPAPKEAAVSVPMIPTEEPTLIPFAGMRKVISERMGYSLRTMAQANHRMKVDMSEAIRVREAYKAAGLKISYIDILTRAVSKALLEHPMMNSELTEQGLLVKPYVNMGLAVAIDKGLIVPNIKNAQRMRLEELSKASAELIAKAKEGRLLPDEYAGGTFTITNLGMFDVDEFTAIVNPPEVGILAVGKIEKTPVVEGDSIVAKPIMVLSLTYDHRVVDGAPAAQFLQSVKKYLQQPYLML